MTKTFHVILIKPARYDDDGYPIQWRRIVYPSFCLSLLNAMVKDCAARRILGPDVDIVVEAHDDQCGLPSMDEMIGRIKGAAAGGLMALVGVHTAHFPRGAALVRRFRAAGVPVVIGGSHVSGSLASLPAPPPEIQEMLDLGVSLFTGEAEGRLEAVLRDARAGTMRAVYDFGGVPVDMETALLPDHVPDAVIRRIPRDLNPVNPIEAGRGCPFTCTFCTVINVHGRQPRARTPDGIAGFVRNSVAGGRSRFMFTDDNFARNKKWREILEALVRLKEEEGLSFSFILQVDTQSDRIPGFIPLAVRAGCVQIFVGMESINPEALQEVGKKQNAVGQYRRFFQAWKRHGVVIMTGFIVGFPTDTPESIRRDLETIKRELPLDLIYLFILTPLPGSPEHSELVKAGVALDTEPSRYTTFHATRDHPRMSRQQLEALYYEGWRIYYEDAHVERVLRRHVAWGGDLDDLIPFVLVARGAFAIEDVNPSEFGIVRVKARRERRPDLPREAFLPFAARRAWSLLSAQTRWAWQVIRLKQIVRRAKRGDPRQLHDDPALTGLFDASAPAAVAPTPDRVAV